MDSIGGDGSLEEAELVDFMFPGNGSQDGGDDDQAGEDHHADSTANNTKAARSNSEIQMGGASMNPML